MNTRTESPPVLALIALGALLGAALGVFDLSLVFDYDDPSVVRRAWRLTVFAGVQGGVVGAAVCAFAAVVTWLGRRRSSAGSVGALFFGASVFCIALSSWIVCEGEARGLERRLFRAGWAALWLSTSVLAGWCALLGARRVLSSSNGAAGRTLRRWLVALAAVLLVGSVARLQLSGVRTTADMSAQGPAPADAPNIVFVVVDTLRADVLGAYGGEGNPTPVMDSLAREGVLFERAVATSSWTLPSVISLMTSKLPTEHGFARFRGVMRDDLDVLPEILSEAGYRCRAVVANELMTHARGFARGFEMYDTYGWGIEGALVSSKLLDRMLVTVGLLPARGASRRTIFHLSAAYPFLRSRVMHYLYDEEINDRVFRYALEPTDRPLFLYVHYLAPHSPYFEHPYDLLPNPPFIEPELKDELWRRYIGEVNYNDAAIGRLIDGLGEIAKDAIIVLTSDHGEEFWEHGGKRHGFGVYQEVVHVPLIFRAPGAIAGTRVARATSLVDVAPTLLDLVGLPIPPAFRGKSLATVLRGGADEGASDPIFTELLAQHGITEEEHYGVIRGNRKVIRTVSLRGKDPKIEVYDLDADPRETQPLEVTDDLRELIEALEAQEREVVDGEGETQGLTDAEHDKLRALGYVED